MSGHADTVGTLLLAHRGLADAGVSRAECVCLAAAQPSADLALGSNRQAPNGCCAVVRIQGAQHHLWFKKARRPASRRHKSAIVYLH